MIKASYALTRTMPDTDLASARKRIIESLKAEGFGVLTEIDVQATLKKKIDVDFRPYVILGACNPHLAHRTLQHDLGMGLLLPCNVVVAEADDGTAIVSVVKPEAMFQVVDGSGALEDLAKEATDRLTRALQAA